MKSKRSRNKRTYAQVSAALVEAANVLQSRNNVTTSVEDAAAILDKAMLDFNPDKIKYLLKKASAGKLGPRAAQYLKFYHLQAGNLRDAVAKAIFFLRHK